MSESLKYSEELKKKLTKAGDKLVVIDFHATWCGPCRKIDPEVEKLAKEHTEVVFIKVDIDKCERIFTKFDIICIPTFVFVKNKKKIEEFSGADADKLKATILKFK